MAKAQHKEKPENPACRNHSDQEATHRCDNCKKPYCKKCVREQGHDRVFCAECELRVAGFLNLI
ncbi:MAG: hypothetical protein GTN74_06945 [Proteobacteria bacterium]|nr:hypothetical protein [Pseudomonadota bacterium]NIS69334.1 hypothetical protein [Pseudomonadota bacterium]